MHRPDTGPRIRQLRRIVAKKTQCRWDAHAPPGDACEGAWPLELFLALMALPVCTVHSDCAKEPFWRVELLAQASRARRQPR